MTLERSSLLRTTHMLCSHPRHHHAHQLHMVYKRSRQHQCSAPMSKQCTVSRHQSPRQPCPQHRQCTQQTQPTRTHPYRTNHTQSRHSSPDQPDQMSKHRSWSLHPQHTSQQGTYCTQSKRHYPSLQVQHHSHCMTWRLQTSTDRLRKTRTLSTGRCRDQRVHSHTQCKQ